MPVMEGKAALFKRFAGVDAWPVCLDTQDTEEIIRTVQIIAPVYGGINLEDIAAPRCFEIEARLRELLDIPVFHDDQHGTAIVVLGRAAQRAAGGRQGARPTAGSWSAGSGAAGIGDHPAAAAARSRATCSPCDIDGIVHRGPARAWTPTWPGSPSTTNPARRRRHAGRRAGRRRRVHRRVGAEPVRRGRAGHDGRPARSCSRWPTRTRRSTRRVAHAARRGRRHRPVGLPEPDQQRARVPRRVPRPARRAGRATSPTRCCSPRPTAIADVVADELNPSLHRAQRVRRRRWRRRWRRRCARRVPGACGASRSILGHVPVIGVLALQGDVREHVAALSRAGCGRCRCAGPPSWTPSTRWCSPAASRPR